MSPQDIQLITAVSPYYVWQFRLHLSPITKKIIWGNNDPLIFFFSVPQSSSLFSLLRNLYLNYIIWSVNLLSKSDISFKSFEKKTLFYKLKQGFQMPSVTRWPPLRRQGHLHGGLNHLLLCRTTGSHIIHSRLSSALWQERASAKRGTDRGLHVFQICKVFTSEYPAVLWH